jgi:ACS family hexuronate transporter-like MFS transporter
MARTDRSALARWSPAIAMMLVSLISYVDRNTLAILSPTILAETRLSAEEYGWIITAFSIAYMIGNPVWGRALDRIGVRLGMMMAVALWSLASASHTFASGILTFAAARALLGFGEGATFPGGLRTVTQTLPERSRARGIAVAYSGGSLGAIITPLAITPVALALGWRAAFLCTGALGAAWLLLWAFVSRAPSVRAIPQVANTAPPSARDPRLWAFVAAYALGAIPLGFVTYAAPIYLSRALGHDQATLGAVLWIPPLGWEVGYFFWGHRTDLLIEKGRLVIASEEGTPARDALVPLMMILALLGLPLAGVPLLRHPALVLGALFFAMFVASGFVIAAIAYATRVFSAAHAAYVAGLGAGGWSAMIALVMPLFGRLFDHRAYALAFAIAAFAPVLGTLAWWWASGGARSQAPCRNDVP